jgi:hypothetical protein
MPEEVTFDAHNQLIRVRSWGKCGIQDWHSSKDQVLKLNSEHGCNKLLVDVREQEAAPSITEIFEFGVNWPRSIRVALLVGKDTEKDQRFLETVAFNRGIPMKDFTEEDEAIEWLNR